VFEADIRRHLDVPEDVLTSRVFGSVSLMTDRRVRAFCVLLGAPARPVGRPTFTFWPTYRTCEPDVEIRSGTRWALFVEAKDGSPLTADQLCNEYREGAPVLGRLRVVAVTRDAIEPPAALPYIRVRFRYSALRMGSRTGAKRSEAGSSTK